MRRCSRKRDPQFYQRSNRYGSYHYDSCRSQQTFADKVEKVVIDANGKKWKELTLKPLIWQLKKKPEKERKYPLFIYKTDKGSIYLMSVRGNGLWDKIWGTIAIKDDFNTIAGASFGHVGETPGLGAEIKDNASFLNPSTIKNHAGWTICISKGG